MAQAVLASETRVSRSVLGQPEQGGYAILAGVRHRSERFLVGRPGQAPEPTPQWEAPPCGRHRCRERSDPLNCGIERR